MNRCYIIVLFVIWLATYHSQYAFAGSLQIISTFEENGEMKAGNSDSGFLSESSWVISPVDNAGTIVFLSKASNFDTRDVGGGADVYNYSSASGIKTLSLATLINRNFPLALSVAFGGDNYAELRQNTDANDQNQILLWRKIDSPVSHLSAIAGGSKFFNHLKLSDNGSFLVYEADDNLEVDTVLDTQSDIYMRELGVSRQPIRISIKSKTPSAGSFWPDVSNSGQQVVFESSDGGFDMNDRNNVSDIFLWNDGNIQRINKKLSDSETTEASHQPAISGDGTKIVFVSRDSDIVQNDTNAKKDIFLYETGSGTVEPVNLIDGLFQGDDDSDEPDIDDTGRYLVFRSKSSNFPGAVDSVFQIYVVDVQTKKMECVSLGIDGMGADSSCSSPAISPNGRYITFSSSASNLSNLMNSNYHQVYRYDRDGNNRPVVTDVKLDCNKDTTASPCNIQVKGEDAETSESSLMYRLSELPESGIGVVSDKDNNPILINQPFTPAKLPLKFQLSDKTTNHYISFSYQVSDGQVWSIPASVFITLADFSIGYLSVESTVDGTAGPNSVFGNASSPVFKDRDSIGFSGNGRWVLFSSDSTNLTVQGVGGIFLRDSVSGKTKLVNNFSTNNTFTNLPHLPVISLNGNAIAYVDLSANPQQLYWSLIDKNGNISAPITMSVSAPTNLSISADGKALVFNTFDALVSDDNEPSLATDRDLYRDVYIWRPLNGKLELVSQGKNKEQTEKSCILPSISPDGNRVAFITKGEFSNTPGNESTTNAVWIKYLDSGNIVRHLNTGGDMSFPTLSWTGRFVSYGIESSIEVADLTQLSSNRIIKTIANAKFPRLSADGRYLYFVSPATGFTFENSSFRSPSNSQDHAYRLDLSSVIPDTENRVAPLSVDGLNLYGSGDSYYGQLSEDGRFAVFANDSIDLLGENISTDNVFRMDLGAVSNSLPTAINLPGESTLEDTNHTIDLTAADTEGNDLRYEIVVSPKNGMLSSIDMPELGERSPKVMYNPNDNVFGEDSFTFKVRDAEGYSTIARVTIAVTEVNDPPVMTQITPQTVNENQTLLFQLIAIDPDTDNLTVPKDTLTYSITSGPGQITNGNTYSYKPEFTVASTGNPSIESDVTVQVDDGRDKANSIDSMTFKVTVQNVDRPPRVTEAVLGLENGRVGDDLTVSVSKSDPDGDTIISTQYRWSKNNVIQATFTSARIGNANLVEGDQWFVEVRVFTSTLPSAWVKSNVLNIRYKPTLSIHRLLVIKETKSAVISRDLFDISDRDYTAGIQLDDFSLSIEQFPGKGTLSFNSGGDASLVQLKGLSITYTLNTGIDDSAPNSDSIVFRVRDKNDALGLLSDPVQMNIFIAIVTQKMQLFRGWNLISIKTGPLDQSPLDLFKCPDGTRCIKGFPWRWDAKPGMTKFIRDESVVSSKTGYWIYADRDITLQNIPGNSVTNSRVSVENGWNLIGPSGDGAVASLPGVSDGVSRSIWYWDAANQIFVTADKLEAGRGYWVYVNSGPGQVDLKLN